MSSTRARFPIAHLVLVSNLYIIVMINKLCIQTADRHHSVCVNLKRKTFRTIYGIFPVICGDRRALCPQVFSFPIYVLVYLNSHSKGIAENEYYNSGMW